MDGFSFVDPLEPASQWPDEYSSARHSSLSDYTSPSSNIALYDTADTFSPTLLDNNKYYSQDEGSSYQQRQSGRARSASPYSAKQYATSIQRSPSPSGQRSPFLYDHPLDVKPTLTPPPLAIEPSSSAWTNGEQRYVNMSDLTTPTSSESSPIMSSSSSLVLAPMDAGRQTGNTLPPLSTITRKRRKIVEEDVTSAYSHTASYPDSSSASSYRESEDDDDDYSDGSVYCPNSRASRKRRRTSASARRRASDSDDNSLYGGAGGRKSRGRKVPVAPEYRQDEGEEGPEAAPKVTPMSSIPFGVKKAGAPNKGKRRYVCTYDGCGKCFVRGEHLKRHVKSLHLGEKPHKCPHSGCTKAFSRKDNLKQHTSIFH